eukprot:Nk52_evm11s304 gene=Nk52_evmTU11s304
MSSVKSPPAFNAQRSRTGQNPISGTGAGGGAGRQAMNRRRESEVLKQFLKDDFDHEEYVLNIAAHVKDASELKAHKTKLQHYVDHTANAMKKNVYRNYSQFICANKEIQNLEAEVYDLKSFLNEEKQIMADLKDISLGDSFHTDTVREKALSEANVEAVEDLLESVEALEQDMVVCLDRYLVCAMELVELSLDTYTFLRTVKFCLFSDSIIMCERAEQPAEALALGRKEFFFFKFVELSRAAVVDIKDSAKIRNAFKLFVGKDCCIYECETASKKERLIKMILSTEENRTQMVKNRRADAKRSKVNRENLIEKKKMALKQASVLVEMKHNRSLPEWLVNMPDDLDMYIAQRAFEQATDLIERAGKFLDHQDILDDSDRLVSFQKDLRVHRNLLSEVLINDLRNPSLKLFSLHRSVGLLTRLGFREQAREMFLQSRSRLFRHAIRNLKIEGATDLYVSKLSRVFFLGLRNTVLEVNVSFPDSQSRADFVCWAVHEVEAYIDIFSRQVFFAHNFTTVADCLIILFTHAKVVNEVGLDMEGFVRLELKDKIIGAIESSGSVAMNQLQAFLDVETWAPVAPQSKRGSLKRSSTGGGDRSDRISSAGGVSALMCQTCKIFCEDLETFLSKIIQIYETTLHETIVNRISSQIEYFFPRLMKAVDTHEGETRERILSYATFIAENVLSDVLEKLKAAVGRNVVEIEKFKRAMIKSLAKRGVELREAPGSGSHPPKPKGKLVGGERDTSTPPIVVHETDSQSGSAGNDEGATLDAGSDK